MFIKRNILEEIKPFLKRREFVAIIGPRQSGKTTFLEIIREYLIKERKLKKESIHLLTFEDRRLLREFESDPVSFVTSYLSNDSNETIYLMLDEFQYADEGGQKLKLVYDTVKNIKIIITGSSSLEIKAQVGRYMVGRILTFQLYPFSFQELLRAEDSRLEKIYRQKHNAISSWLFEYKTIKFGTGEDVFFYEMLNYYQQHCIWGGYPAVILAKSNEERSKLLGDIYNSYVLKDIKGLLELATERNLFLLSEYLATQIGNILVYQNLGQRAALDYRKLKKHMNILKETFVINEVRPYFKNRQKELTKNPKIYFMDIGFRNYLIENMNNLDKRSDSGAIVENIVFIRIDEMGKRTDKINFWQTKAGAEVDFVLRIKDKIIPIEVKFSRFEDVKISRSLASFIDSFKPKRALVLTKNYWGNIKRDNTEVLFAPVYYF